MTDRDSDSSLDRWCDALEYTCNVRRRRDDLDSLLIERCSSVDLLPRLDACFRLEQEGLLVRTLLLGDQERACEAER